MPEMINSSTAMTIAIRQPVTTSARRREIRVSTTCIGSLHDGLRRCFSPRATSWCTRSGDPKVGHVGHSGWITKGTWRWGQHGGNEAAVDCDSTPARRGDLLRCHVGECQVKY